MQVLQSFLGAARRQNIPAFAALCGGFLIFLCAFLVGVDVVLRKLFAVTLGGADELSGYALGIASTWSLAYAFLKRAHIRIDFFYNLVPMKARAFLNITALVAFFGFFAFLAWRALEVCRESWGANSVSLSALEIPLIIPQGLWTAGLFFFSAVLLFVLGKAVHLLLKGEYGVIEKQIGPQTVREELEEATASVQKANEGQKTNEGRSA